MTLRLTPPPVEGEKTAHTPGPWRVEDGTTLIWGCCNPDDDTSYGMGFPIAECRISPAASWAKGPTSYEEAEANARLIAAAPDFYLAAKQLLSAFDELRSMTAAERIICGRSNAEIRKVSDEAMAGLRDATLRAEGRAARKDGA